MNGEGGSAAVLCTLLMFPFKIVDHMQGRIANIINNFFEAQRTEIALYKLNTYSSQILFESNNEVYRPRGAVL